MAKTQQKKKKKPTFGYVTETALAFSTLLLETHCQEHAFFSQY